MKITIDQKTEKDIQVVVQGRIDTVTSPQFAAALKEVDIYGKNVTFDFTDVEYVSSAGLRHLLAAKQSNGDGVMRLLNVSDEVLDVLKMTGVENYFEISGNEDKKTSYVQKSFKRILKEKNEYPYSVFLTEGDVVYTWGDIERCSQIIAHDLAGLGVKKGSHVGICSANSANWVLTFFAVQKLGAIACLLNFGYGPEEIVTVARAGDVDVLCYGEISTMTDEKSFLSAITADESPIKATYDIRRTIQFMDRSSEYDAIAALYSEPVESDDACVMIYTSGSTGVPKGVLLSSYNILNASRSMSETIRITEEDKLCLILPLFHIFGMTAGLFCNILEDGQVVIPQDIRTATILETIEKQQCTLFHSVPTMLLALMNNKNFDFNRISSLRASILAGAPVTQTQLIEMSERFEGVRFFCAYGLSEMAPVSITGYDDSIELVATTVGKPVENIGIRIVSTETGEICKPGETGEIQVEGYNLMLYYYKVDLKDQAIDAEGWLHTGDMGMLDESGYLHITGRLKELIIRGGENIMPSEVEGAVSKHPDVENVKVVGVPDAFFGEVVCACIVMRPGTVFDEETMKTFLSEQLAKYKLPAYYMVYDEFPKLASGKMDSVTIKRDAVAKYGKP
ncbi:MAG: AMP-binding protein [Eubacterium sp.]|nr:AMP-binding protein [Eubacterium sp.]